MAKDNKDPWHKDNIGKTLEERANQFQNLVGQLQAMDGELKGKIARKLKDASDNDRVDYTIIDRTSKKYDSKIADEVRDIIDKHYDTENDLSPLNEAFDKSKADDYTKEMVVHLYHGHKQELMKEVGRKDYHTFMEDKHRSNLNQVINKLASSAPAGYDPEKHGESVADWFTKEYNLDKKYINKEMLKRNAHMIISQHIGGQLNADSVYSTAPEYKKKKAA